MSRFYKMDPAAWDFGTANLTLEQEAAYLRLVNAMHKHDGPVPDNDRVLAGLFRVSTRKARALLNALVDAEKVTIEGGQIWNERARSDVVQRQFASISHAENGAKGGRTRAERAAKSLNDNDTGQAKASSRIEENRIEDNPPTPQGGSAYVFEGRVVKLNASDFERWRKTYHGIPDLAAELAGIDGWFADHPDKAGRWFHAVPGMLNRKHQAALAEAKANPKGRASVAQVGF